MDIRTSLITLAEFALKSATEESDRLAVYDAVADIAILRIDCQRIRILAEDASVAIRQADDLQLQFRELLTLDGGEQSHD